LQKTKTVQVSVGDKEEKMGTKIILAKNPLPFKTQTALISNGGDYVAVDSTFILAITYESTTDSLIQGRAYRFYHLRDGSIITVVFKSGENIAESIVLS